VAAKSLTVNPKQWSWTPATQPAGDTVSDYVIGIRDQNAAGSVAGTYPITVTVTSGNTEPVSAAMAMLASPGDYQSAIKAQGNAPDSAWSAEVTATAPGNGTDFSLEPAPLVPPTAFFVA
jgi:hypothetical protein